MDPETTNSLRQQAACLLSAHEWMSQNRHLAESDDQDERDDYENREDDLLWAEHVVHEAIDGHGLYLVLPVLREVEREHNERSERGLPSDAFGDLLTYENFEGAWVPYRGHVAWRMASAAMTLPAHVLEAVQNVHADLLRAGADEWGVHDLVVALTGTVMFPDVPEPEDEPADTVNWLKEGF